MLPSRSLVRPAFLFACLGGVLVALGARQHIWMGLALALVVAVVLGGWLRGRLRHEAELLCGLLPGVSRELAPVLAGQRRSEEDAHQELARLEEKRLQLEVLLEGMQDGVLGVDASRRLAWNNAEMTRILDRHGLGAAVRLGRSLAHTLRDPALLEAVDQAIEQRSPVNLRSATILPGRIFDVNAAPLLSGGAVLVLRDVTRSEALEQTQRDFVANVSHELRTPLTSVRGYAETLLDTGVVAPAAQPWLQTILKNVERMSRLTEDLLMLARIEEPDRQVVRRSVAARDLVQDAVQTFQGQVGEGEVLLTVGEVSDRRVIVDELAILQVLGNLLENASKYGRTSPACPARIVIAAEPESTDDSGRALIAFRIRDFGPGIAMEHHSRIFERFYRVDKARSREDGGTGLGLAIARYLVEENGGRLSLQSKLGEGAEFSVLLPAASEEDEVATAGTEYRVPVQIGSDDRIQADALGLQP